MTDTTAKKVLSSRVFRGDEVDVDDRRITVGPEVPEEVTAAEEVSEEVREELYAAWRLEQEEKLERACQKARREGYADGYKEAEQDMRTAFQKERRQWQRALALIESIGNDLADRIERSAPPLLLEVASKVLGQDLPPSLKTALAPALQSAVSEMSTAETLTITLHPADVDMLEAAGVLDEIEAGPYDLTIKTDADLEEGDWRVASPDAVLQRLKEEVVSRIDHAIRSALSSPRNDIQQQ